MRIAGLRLLVIAVLAALSLTTAHAVVVDLQATKDNTLFEEDDKKSNGAGDYFFAGNTDNAETRRALVAFDVSGIPPGSTINDATLTLFMSRTKASNTSVSLHRVLADWGEGNSNAGGQEGGGATSELDDASWRYRFYDPGDEPGSPQWSALGGDYVAGASATQTVGNSGFYSWTAAGMAADVEGWVNAPATNFGWIVRGTESGSKTAKRFNSRQNSDSTRRPVLTVDYTPPAVDGACCFPGQNCQVLSAADCGNQSGNFLGAGTTCSPNPCPPDPTGACCRTDSPWICSEETQADCSAVGGTYRGDGEQCSLIDAQGGCPVILTPFVDPLPVPAVAQPVSGTVGGAASYNIVMQELQQQLHNDLPPTTVWGYGDAPDPFDPATTYASFPGPTIVARSGEPVSVRYHNELRDTSLGGSPPPLRTSHYLNVDTCAHGANDQSPRTVVHLHGGHVPPEFDGYPEETFLPGEEVMVDGSPGYVYENNQQASLLWFHDHALGITRLNVYMGTASGYLIQDDVEDALNLPRGAYDVPLIVQDRTFKATPLGQWRYPEDWVENFFGDTALVNGMVWPFLNVDQGKYRFRLLNGSNSRRYVFSLDRLDVAGEADVPFQIIGNDGGLLPAPVGPLTEITMGPAERADMIVDFAALPAGTEVVLKNSGFIPTAPDITQIMKFVVGNSAGDTDPLPTSLRPVEPIDESSAVIRREFMLRKGSDACTGQAWEIKSRNSDGVEVGARWEDITEYPQLGSTEIWEFINPSVVPHPMHMHLVFFQILNRQPFEIVDDQVVLTGPPEPPAPWEAGWKDTARAEPGKILRVITRFTDYTGLYAYHCHILEHEDHEMMRQFWTVDPIDLSMTETDITWQAVPGSTGYDVVRGELSTLLASGGNYFLATQTCVLNGQPVTSTSHTGLPPLPGDAYWYLSRKRDVIGKGTYDSGSSFQVDLRDDEIVGSGADCP